MIQGNYVRMDTLMISIMIIISIYDSDDDCIFDSVEISVNIAIYYVYIISEMIYVKSVIDTKLRLINTK